MVLSPQETCMATQPKADNQRAPTDQEIDKIRSWALENIRGTVQADILKEE